MKKIFFFILLSVHVAYGQNNTYDSLQKLMIAENQSEKKLTLIKQLVDEASNYNLNLGLEASKIGVATALAHNNQQWLPQFYEMEGRMYANLLQLDSASLYFDKALKKYAAIGNKKGQATTLFKIAWVHKKREEIKKAMELDLRALAIMEELNDKKGIANAYTRVTEDLNRQGRNKEALAYALKTIKLCIDQQFEEELMIAYFMAADVHITMGNFLASYHYYDSTIALAYKLKEGDMGLSDFKNGMGNALKKLGRYKEALASYTEAFNLATKSNYNNAVSATTANLGEINLLMGNYPEALKYQLETVRLQEKDNDYSNLTENYTHVSTIYEKLGKYKLALVYQKKARRLRDSTATAESDKAMLKMLTQFETKKKEETIKNQALQISEQSKVQWLSIGVLALLVAFLFFGFISYRSRTKKNDLLAAKNAENELLLKEIHHRVKNNLEVVSSLLELQSAQIDDPNTKEAMLEGQNRVQSIGIVHQKLYQGANLGAIEMKDYFVNLSDSILDSFGADKRVTITCAMDRLDLDIDTAVPLGLIVNELLTNTLKYAFPKGQHGKVEIKLQKLKNEILHLAVSDNGIGKSQAINGTGFGSKLILLLTQQLNGQMTEEVNHGTRIYFNFDLKKAS